MHVDSPHFFITTSYSPSGRASFAVVSDTTKLMPLPLHLAHAMGLTARPSHADCERRRASERAPSSASPPTHRCATGRTPSSDPPAIRRHSSERAPPSDQLLTCRCVSNQTPSPAPPPTPSLRQRTREANDAKAPSPAPPPPLLHEQARDRHRCQGTIVRLDADVCCANKQALSSTPPPTPLPTQIAREGQPTKPRHRHLPRH